MVQTGRKYVFDFDSTLTRVEALDVLAEMTLQGNPKRDEIVKEIQRITNFGNGNEIGIYYQCVVGITNVEERIQFQRSEGRRHFIFL